MLLIVLSIFSVLVVWQHIARSKNSNFKPSVALWKGVDLSKWLFLTIGNGFARVSSILIHIKNMFVDIWDSLVELFEPVFRIIISPIYIVRGYVKTMMTYTYSLLIPIGSVAIIGTIIGIINYFYSSLTEEGRVYDFYGKRFILVLPWTDYVGPILLFSVVGCIFFLFLFAITDFMDEPPTTQPTTQPISTNSRVVTNGITGSRHIEMDNLKTEDEMERKYQDEVVEKKPRKTVSKRST